MGKNIYGKANVSVNSWEEAIRSAGEILLNKGYIKNEYIDNMIGAVKEYGPYIVIDEGIALAHANPADGAIKTGISVITLNPPIDFGCDNDPVKILIALSAADNNDHIQVLASLAEFLSDKNNITMLEKADGKEIENLVRGII